MDWKPVPTLDELKRYYEYNPETGIVILKEMRCNSDAKRVGKQIGNLRRRSNTLVWTINHKYKNFYLSRFIWKLMTEEDPGKLIVEHKNRDSTDNRWCNLRLATFSQNTFNRFSMGYSKRKESGKYRARVTVDGKRVSIGSFDNEEDAKQALLLARKQYYGEFAYLEL
jgi:hypothetical protein